MVTAVAPVRSAVRPVIVRNPVPVYEVKRAQVRLFVAEVQELLRDSYLQSFADHAGIRMVGDTADLSSDSFSSAVVAAQPEVVLLGVRVLDEAVIQVMSALRQAMPQLGFVVLASLSSRDGLQALRAFIRTHKAGCAYVPKGTIDSTRQLSQVISSVAEGRLLLDQSAMEGMMTSQDSTGSQLKELSARELEVLGLMAKGLRNVTIAEMLCLEPKTVERHINNLYSKLPEVSDSKHPRVHAVTLYLRATGQLAGEGAAA